MNEERRSPITTEQFELKKGGDQSRLYFGVPKDFGSWAGELSEAIQESDPTRLVRLANNSQAVEFAIVQKGEQGRYLSEIIHLADILTRQAIGIEEMSLLTTPEEMRAFLQRTGVSPKFMTDVAGAKYHLRQDDVADRLYRLIIQAGRDNIGSLVEGAAWNGLASIRARSRNYAEASKLNGQARKAVKRADPTDPNTPFQVLKVAHGLSWDKMQAGVTEDGIQEFREIIKAREQIGDVVHVGRAQLDLARLLLRFGRIEEALFFGDQAYQSLASCGYDSAAVDALQLVGGIHSKTGTAERSKRVWEKGVDLGETLGEIKDPEVKEMRELSKLRKPACCMVELTDGNYLFVIEKTEDGQVTYQCPWVEQEVEGLSPKGALAHGLQARLNHIYRQATGLQEGEVVELSANKIKNFSRSIADGTVDGFKINLRKGVNIDKIVGLDLDKMREMGYTILSFAELNLVLDKCDPHTKELVQQEIDRSNE